MEYSLRLKSTVSMGQSTSVLILILMEYSLRQRAKSPLKLQLVGLNPYSNGI